MKENKKLKEAWENACREEGIPIDSKFAVFRQDNVAGRKYQRMMDAYIQAIGEY